MEPVTVYQLSSGAQSGAMNMAVDETLLEWFRNRPECPVFMVRTYQWDKPTLSYGVHQAEDEVRKLYERYAREISPYVGVVRRPTGGRAILHGEDLSFSFMTNLPSVTRLTLKESYGFLMDRVSEAFQEVGVELQCAGGRCDARPRSYTLSSICFETKTPSDLLDVAGKKVAGCSQLRRDGGVLQHGAAFIRPYAIEPQALTDALFKAVARAFEDATPENFEIEADPAFLVELEQRLESYRSASAGILQNASTTTGSHLTSTSF